MSDKTRHTVTTDSRHRVAYEMALMMWWKSNSGRDPSIEDKKKFLELVSDCTAALSHHYA